MSSLKTNGESLPRFIYAFVGIVLALPVVLWLFGEFSGRTYFITSFIWLLISSEVFVPTEPDSSWLRRLQWVKLAGWLVFLAIIVERILATLQ